MNGIFYLRMATECLQYFLLFFLGILIKFGTGGVHKDTLCDCAFCEYRHSESHTLHATVNVFLSVISIFLVRFPLELRKKKDIHIRLLVI